MNLRAGLPIRISGLISAACTLAGIGTLLGYVGHVHWLADLFSHFRVQYFIGLATGAILLRLMNEKKQAVLFFFTAFLNLPPLLPLYVKPPIDELQTPIYRAMLINVNSQNRYADRILEATAAHDADILVLEEITNHWVQKLGSLTNLYPYSHIEPQEDNFGIAVYSKHPIEHSEVTYIGIASVPSIKARIQFATKTLQLLATHPLPPAGADYSAYRNEQLEKLPQHLPRQQPTMVLGDLNTTHWNHHFKTMLERSRLLDSAKGFGIQATWPAGRIFPLGIPIDHCLHSPELLIRNRFTGANVGSDHLPLIIDFQFRP